MGILYKALIVSQLLIMLVADNGLGNPELVTVLLLLLLQVWRERLLNSIYLLLLEIAIVTVAVYYGLPIGLWYVLTVFDLASKRIYGGIALVAGCAYVFSLYSAIHTLPLLLGFSVLLALALQRMQSQNSEYQITLDKERRLRYSLEEAKQQLLRSQDEIAHISEIQERNRIAREIHDHVGHSIAGILMQMQVAHQFMDRDRERARGAVEKCVTKLAEALEILRDTVHNMRPVERLGIAYIKGIINEYDYCLVEFNHSGDFATLPPRFLETAGVIIKEALTNTSRYSKASKVIIELDVNDKYLRFSIKDNGRGAERITEGLGLSSMRERVANMGGTFSVSGKDGFLIVCVLYR